MADNSDFLQKALAGYQQDNLGYKAKLKEENAIIKRITESDTFNVALLKEHKDTVTMYRRFIAENTKIIREIEERIIRDSEPGKLGRPSIGKPRAVKITLPEEDWAYIDQVVAAKKASSVADYFRSLHDSSGVEV